MRRVASLLVIVALAGGSGFSCLSAAEDPHCCAPDPRPDCCMVYGGWSQSGGCGRLCDAMPLPNDPHTTLRLTRRWLVAAPCAFVSVIHGFVSGWATSGMETCFYAVLVTTFVARVFFLRRNDAVAVALLLAILLTRIEGIIVAGAWGVVVLRDVVAGGKARRRMGCSLTLLKRDVHSLALVLFVGVSVVSLLRGPVSHFSRYSSHLLPVAVLMGASAFDLLVRRLPIGALRSRYGRVRRPWSRSTSSTTLPTGTQATRCAAGPWGSTPRRTPTARGPCCRATSAQSPTAGRSAPAERTRQCEHPHQIHGQDHRHIERHVPEWAITARPQREDQHDGAEVHRRDPPLHPREVHGIPSSAARSSAVIGHRTKSVPSGLQRAGSDATRAHTASRFESTRHTASPSPAMGPSSRSFSNGSMWGKIFTGHCGEYPPGV
ncbi:MAG TPA: hypothetical protein VF316_02480, partial [Polyangiaceae bacterium]